MAIELRSDGTLVCNTVKYKYKQTKNLIADGSGDGLTRIWKVQEGDSIDNYLVGDGSGHRSYRYFSIKDGPGISQTLSSFVAGHKYYFSFRYRVQPNSPKPVINYPKGLLNGYGYIYFESLEESADLNNTSWKLSSLVFITPDDYVNMSLIGLLPKISISKSSENIGEARYCRFIGVDLTDAFGEGNEPSKEWCDNNIIEQGIFNNFGTLSDHVDNTNIDNIYIGSGQLSLTSHSESIVTDSASIPREYCYRIEMDSQAQEAYLKSQNNWELQNNLLYYFRVYYVSSNEDFSFDWYFKEVEPSVGINNVRAVKGEKYNSGGGMSKWKKCSFFGNRSGIENGSYVSRLDINNNNQTGQVYLGGIIATKIYDNGQMLAKYNSYYNSSITVNDVNKEWCDRWVGGRTNPIIHIKDHGNTKIEFIEDHIISCNDIEIHPEMDHIEFDYQTGTIKCKKLIKAQTY